jgi:hypothetical protein
MRRPEACVAGGLALALITGTGSQVARADSRSLTASAAATATPCPRTLKFGGALYLDTDVAVPRGEVGPEVGETEPNPTLCALPDRLTVYRHNGHSASEEVVYRPTLDSAELFRSAGQTGFPGGSLVRWLVVALVLGVVLFAAVPAILGHLRQPPVAVGRDDTNWTDDA